MVAIIIRVLMLILVFSLVSTVFLFIVLRLGERTAMCISAVWSGLLFYYIMRAEWRKHGRA